MTRAAALSAIRDRERGDDSPSVVAQVLVVVAVVLCGDANLITKQIAARTLGRFDYVLGLMSAVAYFVVYWGILCFIGASGTVKDIRGQLKWVWCNRNTLKCQPVIQLFALAALGDALGDVLGYVCTPYVAGPVHALLAQCTTIFTALLSVCMLGRRYSLLQVSALVVVICATALGVLPNLMKETSGVTENSTAVVGLGENATARTGTVMTKNGTSAFYALIIGFSCIFNAFAFVMKELVFRGYKIWAEEQSPSPASASMNIFVANTAESTMQFPFTLMLIPLAQAMGQTNGDSLGVFLNEALACSAWGIQQDLGGEEQCQYAPLATCAFIISNLAWNIAILLSVKWNGALTTFVALKAVMPTAALLFAYVPWPILDKTPLHPITWVSLSVVLPCIAVFTFASRAQDARKEKGQATCCWPLGAKNEESESTEEGESASFDSLLEGESTVNSE